jgi:RNA polymerase primary sigma factor
MTTDRLPADFYDKLFAPLDPEERNIMRLRFGLDRGQPRLMEEVGTIVGLSVENIRRIEAQAMSKLRAAD